MSRVELELELELEYRRGGRRASCVRSWRVQRRDSGKGDNGSSSPVWRRDSIGREAGGCGVRNGWSGLRVLVVG